MAHKLRIAGKQVIGRPALLVQIIKTLELKALFLPDQKRILLDSSEPTIKQRWSEAHEVIHGITPWHGSYMQGDNRHTLKPACHEKLESEANFGAARLLFMRDKFDSAISARDLTFSKLKALSKIFGNSITTTLWRAVEHLDIPAVGVITTHPNRIGANFDPLNPCEYLIRSRKFESMFPNVKESDLFSGIRNYCSFATRGPLGEVDLDLVDGNGDTHIFHFETFYNGYSALTLGIHRRRDSLSVHSISRTA